MRFPAVDPAEELLMSRSTRRALWLLVPGLTVVVASHLAVELFPTRWGGPNIGGGLILLLGYLAVVAGLIGLTIAYRDRSR
jgi:hypothetical protein